MTVKAFIPATKYPAVSITGSRCLLNCKYCMGHYLKGMLSAQSPKQLYNLAKNLYRRGARGILVSGGFDSEGKLPLKPFLSVLKEVKEDFDLVVSVHCGLVDKKLARGMRQAKVDVAEYELIVDPLVISEVTRLKDGKPVNFTKSLMWLVEDGPPYVAPHIPMGLRYGEVLSEWSAVDAAADADPYLTVFLVFVPTKGTAMEKIPPPDESKIIDVLNYSRSKFREVAIGCMRPRDYKSMLDPKIIEMSLIDRIAVPKRSVIKRYGLEVIHACCSVPKELMDKFLVQDKTLPS
ncbi:MAG: radical SAM protein [Candidatus Bathyarchaeia archaeon]